MVFHLSAIEGPLLVVFGSPYEHKQKPVKVGPPLKKKNFLDPRVLMLQRFKQFVRFLRPFLDKFTIFMNEKVALTYKLLYLKSARAKLHLNAFVVKHMLHTIYD